MASDLIAIKRHYIDDQLNVPESDNTVGNSKITLTSMWNNIKYGFQNTFRQPKFDFKSPICLLGQLYHIKMSDSVPMTDRQTSTNYIFEKFKNDFTNLLWMTYRKDFIPLLSSDITTDCGWGCMIRSGQMILAQALRIHLFGHRRCDSDIMIHRMIVKWFIDSPDQSLCPFSIHQFVSLGQKLGRRPGDWFGPSSVSFLIKSTLENGGHENQLLKNICCYVAQDCTIYLQDVLDQCQTINEEENNHNSKEWKSILILVPTRLGTESYNPIYSSTIKDLLSLTCCIGIIGGRPKHSLYFVGFQDDKLIYMDPHYSQRTIDINDPQFSLESYHCNKPRKMPIHLIDPSCTVGFFFRTREDYDDFVEYIEERQQHSTSNGNNNSFQHQYHPIFMLHRGRNIETTTGINKKHDSQKDRILRMRYRMVDSHGNVQNIVNGEDFVLL